MNGLILKGGKSSRMGTDKGLMTYQGNQTELDRLYSLMGEWCENIFISVKKHQPELRQDQIEDAFSINSPLNGILSALEKIPSAWLIISCDFPLMKRNTLEYLIQNRDPNMFFSGFYDSDGQKPEPMLGIWEPQSLNHLQQFAQSEISPRKFLLESPIHLLTPPDPQQFLNANTQEDYKKALSILKERRSE